jgi:RNA polymerase sigma-70 factor (ECF subfamily)
MRNVRELLYVLTYMPGLLAEEVASESRGSPNGMPEQTDRSFNDVAREQLPWLYSLARRLASDRAEDVVQDCLMRAYKAYGSLEDVQAAPAWFRQILVNCARDLHRKDMRRVDESPLEEAHEQTLYRRIVDEDPLPYSETVHIDFLHSFSEEDVWSVLDQLQPMYRISLVLVHMEGQSTADVARMLGVPTNTVLSWLHRGRKNFEKKMWDYAEENDLLKDMEGAVR